MSSPAERGDKARETLDAICDDSLETSIERIEANRDEALKHAVSMLFVAILDLLPPGSLVFHTRTEILEWLRAEGLVVLDKQQAETVQKAGDRLAYLADNLHAMIPREVWRDQGADDMQGHYEGDYWAEQTLAEIAQLRVALALLSAGEGPK